MYANIVKRIQLHDNFLHFCQYHDKYFRKWNKEEVKFTSLIDRHLDTCNIVSKKRTPKEAWKGQKESAQLMQTMCTLRT